MAAIAIPAYLGMQERARKGALIRAARASLAEAEVKKLADGYIYFGTPIEMTVGDTERLSVFICTKNFEKELNALKAKRNSDSKIEKIKVGTIMTSRLMGDNFKIESLSHEEQIVAGITLWEYSVTPLKSGIHTLLLSVTVKINIPGIGEKPKDYPVFERKIKVLANPKYTAKGFLSSNWQFIITSAIALIGTLGASSLIIWWIKKSRHKTKK